MILEAIDDLIASLSLRQKISSVAIIDFEGTTVEDTLRDFYAEYPCAGVILFAKNIEGMEQVRSLAKDLQDLASGGLPLFIAVDQEGGLVSRLNFPEVTPLCGNMALGATGSEENSYLAGKICGEELAFLGFNVDFAPVLDVNNNPGNPIIGVRSFGEDPQIAGKMGVSFARGLREAGVIPTGKHFPGHGDTSLDSHLALPTIPHSRKRLEEVELVPFKAAINDGIEMVMTAHIVFPALERGVPATLSRRCLSDLLRGSLGYSGVVITDSMSMQAITQNFGAEDAAVRSLEAGADLVLLCGSRDFQMRSLTAIEEAVLSGRISQERILESLRRILRLKSRFRRSGDEGFMLPCSKHIETMHRITLDSITVVRNEERILPLKPSPDDEILLILPRHFPLSPLGEARERSMLCDIIRARHPKTREMDFPTGGAFSSMEEIAEAGRTARFILLGLYARTGLSEVQRAVAHRLMVLGKPVVAMALSSPYVLTNIPEADAMICSYNYGRLSMEALSSILFGDVSPRGNLPVSIPGLYPAGHGLKW